MKKLSGGEPTFFEGLTEPISKVMEARDLRFCAIAFKRLGGTLQADCEVFRNLDDPNVIMAATEMIHSVLLSHPDLLDQFMVGALPVLRDIRDVMMERAAAAKKGAS